MVVYKARAHDQNVPGKKRARFDLGADLLVSTALYSTPSTNKYIRQKTSSCALEENQVQYMRSRKDC